MFSALYSQVFVLLQKEQDLYRKESLEDSSGESYKQSQHGTRTYGLRTQTKEKHGTFEYKEEEKLQTICFLLYSFLFVRKTEMGGGIKILHYNTSLSSSSSYTLFNSRSH